MGEPQGTNLRRRFQDPFGPPALRRDARDPLTRAQRARVNAIIRGMHRLWGEPIEVVEGELIACEAILDLRRRGEGQ